MTHNDSPKWPGIPDPQEEWRKFCLQIEIGGRYSILALAAMGYFARCLQWATYDEIGTARKLIKLAGGATLRKGPLDG